MADPSTCPPLTRASVQTAHGLIKPYIHRTPIATCQTLNTLASTIPSARDPSTLPKVSASHPASPTESNPQISLFFKCENTQRIGAFKSRGAFHALLHLISTTGLPALRQTGVITHSSGNHAQALALAAKTFQIPAYIVMPSISTPSKIAGTKAQGATVVFSGSTSVEREAVVEKVRGETGAVLVPPYDHPDIILGQGTMGLELEEQVQQEFGEGLDVVVAPIGGGGMLSGVATALAGTGIKVFGAEPDFEGANDAETGLREGKRVEKVSTLTIADGLRTPVGVIPWGVISDKSKLEGIFSVSEEEIKAALRLLMERAKLFVEPSAAVPLAVVLFNEEFRKRIIELSGGKKINLGVVLSGGNTTVEAIAKLFAAPEKVEQRAEGTLGLNGEKKAENVAGCARADTHLERIRDASTALGCREYQSICTS